MMRRLGNDARRQVPSEFLNVYKRKSSSSIYPKFLQSTSNDIPRKMYEREKNRREEKKVFAVFHENFAKFPEKRA